MNALLDKKLDIFFWPPSRAGVMSAWWGHVPFAHWLVAASRPGTIVELGTHNGASFAAFCEAVQREKVSTKCFAVDTWQGDEHAGLYGEQIYADLAHFTALHYGAFAKLVRATFDDAQPYFEDGSIDLLHIDGLHTYDAVKHDFENWLPKMSASGVVLFHDTNVRERDFGVWKLWEELQRRYPSFEFSHAHGLGVLAVGEHAPSAVLDLCRIGKAGGDGLHVLRDRFTQLGERLAEADMARRYTQHAKQLEVANGHLHASLEEHRLHVANLEGLRSSVGTSLAEVGESRRLHDEAVAMVRRTEAELSLAKAAVQRLQGQNDTLHEEYHKALRAIYRSTSWRITRPVRALQPRRLWRKLRSMLRGGRIARDDASLIVESGLFDEGFYAGSAEARRQGKSSLQHYMETGEAAGLAPSARFDPVFYRRRNPDLSAIGSGLLAHYLRHGRSEGRIARSAAQDLVLPIERLDASRPCMLIAVHEASRTGAAILSWNLVLEFSRKYNVITLLRRGGPIEPQFLEASCASIVVTEGIYGHQVELDILAERIVETYHPHFVIANSVETRNFVPAFEKTGVPCVALVHEFSSSVRPVGVLNDLFECASSVVFSASIVADAALRDYGVLAARDYQVIAQGASKLPPGEDVAIVEVERQGVQGRLRALQGNLADIDPAAFLVAGLGTITSRKGVEFFVAAADQARRRAVGRKLVFAWVGKCYSFDEPYLESLMEQIERSGLGDSFVFLGELADLDPVYRRADACLLSSRLDPLPNVAIDAALAGVPVVCFDQASGFAEILNESPATRGLVVPYLDSAAAAAVLCNLAEDPVMLADAQRAMRDMAAARFDMPDYVASIERLGLSAEASIKLASRDHAALVADGRFNADLYGSDPGGVKDASFWLTDYLNSSRLVAPRGRPRTGWLVRRPLEGFHPLIYAEEAEGFDEARDSDPLVHFLQSGCPPGRWKHEVIVPAAARPEIQSDLKVAIHAHFHYPELFGDFLRRVESNKTQVSLFITTTTEAKAEVLRRACVEAGRKGVNIIVTENRGRDIGPMLAGLPPEVFEQHDVVGHFHGKRSPHVEESIGGRWREFLWQHLIGDSYPMLDSIMQAFAADPHLGLVFAEDPHLNDWDCNRLDAERLAARMELPSPLPAHIDFPQGTMFWARPAALKPILDLHLSWQDFPEEPVPIDGTLLHALERLLTFAAAKTGFSYATTYVKQHRR